MTNVNLRKENLTQSLPKGIIKILKYYYPHSSQIKQYVGMLGELKKKFKT